jgi:D-3-phosphoglycerate dehydrogenase / 2-oxoglutarate reductase
MPCVFIADKLESSGIDQLTAAGIEVDNRPGLKDAALLEALRNADAVIVRSATRITAEMLLEPGRLKAVARAGVGVDTIDVEAATRKGIVVMNTPGGNTVSAAEHTIALMFALSRHVAAADASMKMGKWDRNKYMGSQLTGKTLGVIGLGRIGREVAQRALGLGMLVLAFDPFVTPTKVSELGYDAANSVEEMLPKVDYLTVHVPMTEETKGLISAPQLVKMKRTARVLNVSRGGIYNEHDLANALKVGTIAGAGIDVFSTEPPPAENPLLSAPNIILTPHLGASTLEAQENVAVEAAQLLADFLLRGIVANAVNMAALDRTELDALRQYVELTRRLGLLHAQMAQGQIRKATLTYKGELANKKTKLLTAAFTAGLLESRLTQGVNLVNAELIARERGIEIVEVNSPKKGDFASLVQVDIETDKKSYTAAATLFGDQYPRLVQLGAYRLESYLDGTLFIFTHRDVPGLIGFVGNIFGNHNVNIAAMTVGRAGIVPGGDAIGVLNLDGIPPEQAVTAVKGHPNVSSVSVVKLPPMGDLPSWLQ